MTSRRAAAWAAALMLAPCLALAGDETDGAAAIDAARLRQHVEYLASDRLAGRETGTPSIAKAEEYIARAFRAAGLAPLPGREDYFIDFTLHRTGFDFDRTSLRVSTGQASRVGIAGVDFRPFGFSDDGEVEGEVVFAGYGITAPSYGYDDYDGLDVTGKIVLVLRHTPGEKDDDGPFSQAGSSQHATFRKKASVAREHGARAMLLVTDPLNHEPGDDLRLGGNLRLDPPSVSDDDRPAGPPFLAAHVSREMARVIVSGSGLELEEMQSAVDGGTRPAELPLTDTRARIAVGSNSVGEAVPARDVAAFIEGSDPALAGEWIVVGAHHDHVGAFGGEGDTVFNGADDNASGVAGVLELAAAFAAREKTPRRSLLFLTFSGEEKGLLGSRALVERELIPLDHVAFMLNLDMIGRNADRALQVFGDGYVRGLRETVLLANAGPGVELDFAGSAYAGNSDHDAFYERDIPFSFFFTGTHEDYHQLGDHASKLDYDRMESIVDLAYGLVDRIADADVAPEFIHNVPWLGLRAEVVVDDGGAPSARITGVEEGSRAEADGFRVGDVLVAFGDEPLEHARDVGKGFRGIEPGTRTTISVLRGEARHGIPVERTKTGYLGIVPAAVEEDRLAEYRIAPGRGVVVRRVVPDGPAAHAGLVAGDVLIRIDGRPVGMDDLGSRLAQVGAGETVEITIVRDGARAVLRITLGERPDGP